MRQIKFRTWDHTDSKWRQPFGEIYDFQEMIDWERFSVDQFTGLVDINGKWIYENDIVKVGYGTGKVIFHHGSFMIEWLDDKEANMELLASRNDGWIRNDLEVLGNIYENSELVNQIIN